MECIDYKDTNGNDAVVASYKVVVLLSIPKENDLCSYFLCKVERTDDSQEIVEYVGIGPTLLTMKFNEIKDLSCVQDFIDDDSEIFCLDGYEIDGVKVIKCEDFVRRIDSNIAIETTDNLVVCTSTGVQTIEKKKLFEPAISRLLEKINERLRLAQHCCLYADSKAGTKTLTAWGKLYECAYKDMLYKILNEAESRIENFVYPYLTLQKIVPEGEQLINADPYGTMKDVHDLVISEMEAFRNDSLLATCKFAGKNNLIRTVLEKWKRGE